MKRERWQMVDGLDIIRYGGDGRKDSESAENEQKDSESAGTSR